MLIVLALLGSFFADPVQIEQVSIDSPPIVANQGPVEKVTVTYVYPGGLGVYRAIPVGGTQEHDYIGDPGASVNDTIWAIKV